MHNRVEGNAISYLRFQVSIFESERSNNAQRDETTTTHPPLLMIFPFLKKIIDLSL